MQLGKQEGMESLLKSESRTVFWKCWALHWIWGGVPPLWNRDQSSGRHSCTPTQRHKCAEGRAGEWRQTPRATQIPAKGKILPSFKSFAACGEKNRTKATTKPELGQPQTGLTPLPPDPPVVWQRDAAFSTVKLYLLWFQCFFYM